MEPTPEPEIQSRIYRIRGQQVMLDSDLARLYGVQTFRLNEQVKRNITRFPPDFMFRLSSIEWNNLISQSAISNMSSLRSQIAILKKRGKHRKYSPYAFTEHGVAMLSSVLRSERAIHVNIAIIRTFIKLRHALLSNRDLHRRVEKIEGKLNMQETDIRLLIQDVERLKKHPEPDGPINPSIV